MRNCGIKMATDLFRKTGSGPLYRGAACAQLTCWNRSPSGS